jgi:hypothetical protein
MKRIRRTLLLLICFSRAALGEIYTIEDEFDGCEYGKIYPLTNGKFMRCDSYKYFYRYRPKVVADGYKVLAVGERDVRGTILEGEKLITQIDGDWEGCDFDTHRLSNGMYLVCSTYFYEYSFMPTVEAIVIDGVVEAVLIDGEIKDGVSVISR